ncbi:phage gp6-like head-tail connector protein [Micromonospora sp. NPDC049891]|uniref:phage gp6-like head-tail connector protein n=1 Tax=Micromonospora sp. NPDC049891 TaxID=3155655 RepID=UPI0033F0BF19
MANEYTSLELLKEFVGEKTDTFNALLGQCLTTASRAIDAHCRRRFYADDTVSERTYRLGDRLVYEADGDLIIVDDISSVDGLVVEIRNDSSWRTIEDYRTEPDNAVAHNQPITYLRLPGSNWAISLRAEARVTAKWGWPAVPDQVVQATLLQAARLFKRKDSVGGTVGNEEFGFLRITRVDPDVESLLRPFVIRSVG